jgi:hypothetical protein
MILIDHTKKGKMLTPPLMNYNFQDSTYIENTIPEIIWITILVSKFRLRQGTKLGLQFINIVRNSRNIEEIPFYISWFSNLDEDSSDKIKRELKKQNIFDLLNNSLAPLLNIYPKCPLNKVFVTNTHLKTDLTIIKETLNKLYDKRSNETVFTLGNIFHYMSSNGKLMISKNSNLPQFTKLEEYPNTEDSKRIASFIRASSNAFMKEPFIQFDKDWLSYFWNRGLELEPCNI